MRSALFLTVLVAAGIGAAAEQPNAGRPNAGRPNIVVLLADDQTWSDSGAYGNPDVPTPNIDRLASEGMLFTRAFTRTAMCSPTRQQLYTGLYPVRSGAYPNHSIVRDGTKSMVHYFDALGYRVGLAGKSHVGPADSFPFEMLGDMKAEEVGSDPGLAAAQAFMVLDKSQPFFLIMASHDPHAPLTQGDASQFDRAKLTLPPYFVDTPETRDTLARYYAEITHFDGQVGTLLDALDKAKLTDDTLVIYTSEQGSQLPFGKWTLYDTGLHTAFVVRWPGHVEAGSRTDAMVQYVDVVPTLLQVAGGEPAANLDGLSFFDVLTGERTAHRAYVFGVHTNRGIISGVDYPIRSVRGVRYKLILNLMPEATYQNITTVPPQNAVFASWQAKAASGDAHAAARVEAYLHRPAAELYDTWNDPLEMNNLAGKRSLRNEELVLSLELETWMRDQGDQGIVTEKQAEDHVNPQILELRRKRGAAQTPGG